MDILAERFGAPPFTSRCRSDYSKTLVGSGPSQTEVVLAKPQTFMNKSGESVSCLLRELDLECADDQIWVAHDDVDLEAFRLRLRAGGGGLGGHNGLKSIVDHVGSKDFGRVKLGVGRPPGRKSVSNYVLEPVRQKELDEYAVLLETAADAVEHALSEGLEPAMNKFNS